MGKWWFNIGKPWENGGLMVAFHGISWCLGLKLTEGTEHHHVSIGKSTVNSHFQ